MAISPPPAQRGRFEQFDSLRGIAALTVVFSHFALLQPLIGLRHTPLRVMLGGHEAVVMFFVLSGFVLTLQITTSRRLSFGSYMVKRFCRIYLPYIAVVFAGALLFAQTYHGPLDWAGDWFNSTWHRGPSDTDLTNHVLFLGRFDTSQIVPVVWSLVYEMRISIIFPLVVWAVMRFPPVVTMGGAILLSIMVLYWTRLTQGNAMANSVQASWPMTLHYLLMFVTGSVLARQRQNFSTWFATARSRWALLLGSVALYCLSRPLTMRVDAPIGDFLFDWVVTLAVAGIVVGAVVNTHAARMLSVAPLRFLGRVSYSLYLTHTLVLLSIFHALGHVLSPNAVMALSAVLVLPVAYVAYSILERPSIQLGKRLASLAPLVERKA